MPGSGSILPPRIPARSSAAARIGDDMLARRPMPDSFTHGSPDQRQVRFARGSKTGRVAACDSFARIAP